MAHSSFPFFRLARAIVAGAIIVAAAIGLKGRGQTAGQPSGTPNQHADWRDWAGGPEGSRYVAMNQITSGNPNK